MRPYKEQFRRVVRYLRRIENQTADRVGYEDDLWSFFQNCWHLKDWIKNDPTLRGTTLRKDIEKKVKDTKYLEVCADIANRRKHLKLKRRSKHQKRAARRNGKVRANIKLDIRESSSSSSVTTTSEYVVAARGRKDQPLLDLARSVVDEWKALLKRHRLEV